MKVLIIILLFIIIGEIIYIIYRFLINGSNKTRYINGDVTGCANGNGNISTKNIGTLLKQYSIAVQHTAVSETDKNAVKYAVEYMKKFAEKGLLFCFIDKDNLTFNTIEILKNQGVHVYYSEDEDYDDIWHEMKHGIDKYFKTCEKYILLTWSDDKLYNIIPSDYRRYSSYTIKIFIDNIIHYNYMFLFYSVLLSQNISFSDNIKPDHILIWKCLYLN
jgi:hypothetical protein